MDEVFLLGIERWRRQCIRLSAGPGSQLPAGLKVAPASCLLSGGHPCPPTVGETPTGQPPGRRRYFANEDCQEPPKLEFDLLLLWDVFRDHHLCLRCGGMSGACGAGYIP